MKKQSLLLVAFLLATGAYAQTTANTQTLTLRDTTVGTTGAPRITSDAGHTIQLVNTSVSVKSTKVVTAGKHKHCLLDGVAISGSADIRCVQ